MKELKTKVKSFRFTNNKNFYLINYEFKRFCFQNSNNTNNNKISKNSLNYSEFEDRNSKVFKNIKDWWNPKGSMKPLHAYNTFRVNYINKIIRSNNLNDKVNNTQILLNKNCLDIGCGGGLLSESLARLGGNITGIDPNVTSYEIAQKHLDIYEGEEKAFMKSKIKYMNKKVEDLDKQIKYDYIFAFEVIEHINDKKLFIKNISDRLNTGGLLFMSTINKNLISNFMMITIAENILNIINKGSHEYEMFIE